MESAEWAGIGEALSGDGSTSRSHCSFVVHSPNPFGASSMKPVFSINLANTVSPTLMIPRDSTPSQLWCPAAAFSHKQAALTCYAVNFRKISQRSPNRKQEVAGLGVLCTSC